MGKNDTERTWQFPSLPPPQSQTTAPNEICQGGEMYYSLGDPFDDFIVVLLSFFQVRKMVIDHNCIHPAGSCWNATPCPSLPNRADAALVGNSVERGAKYFKLCIR